VSDEYDFEDVTTDAAVSTYDASTPIFEGLIKEIRGLSRKKPDATMSAGKVKIINRVLNDLLQILKPEPAGKYLEALDDESLPQVSDAVLTMVQFESALVSFESRYRRLPALDYRRLCGCLECRFGRGRRRGLVPANFESSAVVRLKYCLRWESDMRSRVKQWDRESFLIAQPNDLTPKRHPGARQLSSCL